MPDPIRGIDPTIPIEIAQAGQSAGPSGAATTGPSPNAASVDSADVARAEALLATISNAAAEIPSIDQTRVAALRQAIEAGTYQVNPQQIALKIVQIEDLLGSGGNTG